MKQRCDSGAGPAASSNARRQVGVGGTQAGMVSSLSRT
jgi:hypothetical protein